MSDEITTTKPRAEAGIINAADRTVSIGAETFKLDDAPFAGKEMLSLIGLRAVLRQGKSFESVVSGEFHKPRGAAVKPKSEWHRAMVAFVVERTKKLGAAKTEAEADAIVSALSAEAKRDWKTDPGVVKHYRKITGQADMPSSIDAVLGIGPAPSAAAA